MSDKRCLSTSLAPKTRFFQECPKPFTNLLLSEREGRTGEYWPEVVAVRQKRPRANINLLLNEFEGRTGSYGPSFFSLRFMMTQARSARAINRRIHNLQYGPRKQG